MRVRRDVEVVVSEDTEAEAQFWAMLGHGTEGWGRPAPKLMPRPDLPVLFTVRLDLDGAKPPIWRRLELAGDLSLAELHDVIQIAMGWTDSHLHQFKMGPDSKDYRMAAFDTDAEELGDETGMHENEVRLDQVVAEVGHRLFYEYDFGDGWEHTLRVESVRAYAGGNVRASVVTGRRECPPEDIGGVDVHNELVAGLAAGTPLDPWVAEKVDWLPPGYDPAEFDVADTDGVVRRLTHGAR